MVAGPEWEDEPLAAQVVPAEEGQEVGCGMVGSQEREDESLAA